MCVHVPEWKCESVCVCVCVHVRRRPLIQERFRVQNFPARNGRLNQKIQKAACFCGYGAGVCGQRRLLRVMDGRFRVGAEEDRDGRETHQRPVRVRVKVKVRVGIGLWVMGYG